MQGTLESENEAAVQRWMEEENLFPISIQAARQAVSPTKAPQRRRVKSRDVGIFYGQLGDLLGAGVPLLRSLRTLIETSPNPRLQAYLKEVHGSVADGQALYEAMSEFPETFPPLHIAMIRAGERASFLEDVLQNLAGFLERLDELRSKVLGAMIYPLLLTCVGLAVMVGALVFFVPRFEPLLAGVDMALPTAAVFGLSKVIRQYGFLLLIALGGAGALLWTGIRSHQGQRMIEKWRLKIPVVGLALKLVAITRFCRILGTMLANSVPMLQALAIAKDATGSALMADQIAAATESVREGKTLTEPLREGGLFPAQIVSMLEVAEEANQLEKVLLQIADTVERRTNRQVDQAVSLLEPVILCAVAAGIGFLAFGLLLPIFTMASSLGG